MEVLPLVLLGVVGIAGPAGGGGNGGGGGSSSSAAGECPRLDALPGRDLAGGLRLAEARTRPARMKGLARLDEMPGNYALHIPRCRSVHTFTMRFALDLVWLDGAGAPVRIDESVGPRRMKMCLRARSVVEANAGRGHAFAGALRGG